MSSMNVSIRPSKVKRHSRRPKKSNKDEIPSLLRYAKAALPAPEAFRFLVAEGYRLSTSERNWLYEEAYA